MESVLVVLAILACPLVMVAMGGIAWVAARARGESPDTGDKAPGPTPTSHETDSLAGRP